MRGEQPVALLSHTLLITRKDLKSKVRSGQRRRGGGQGKRGREQEQKRRGKGEGGDGRRGEGYEGLDYLVKKTCYPQLNTIT